ncbi:MAG: carbohydrate ABC transporter permease [Anaerolineae bacterium]
MRRKDNLFTKIITSVILLLALAFFLFPVLWMFITSFKGQPEFFSYPPVFFPKQIDLRNYIGAMVPPPDGRGGFKSLGDSLIVASSTTIISLLTGSLAAYSLARFRTGGDNLSFWILSTRMFPPVASALPLFFIFQRLKMLDTYPVLIVANTIFNLSFVIWMLKGFFEDLPAELEEAALIDGCTTFGAFWRVALPLIAPGLVATALFAFIFTWNEFMFAMLLTRRNIRTLTVLVPSLVGGHEILWGQIAASGMIAIIPCVALALLLQRYLVRGLTLGAVKG